MSEAIQQLESFIENWTETQEQNKKAFVDQNKCTFCAKCFAACPQEAIRPNSENPLLRGRNPHRTGGGFGRGIGRGLRGWKQ